MVLISNVQNIFLIFWPTNFGREIALAIFADIFNNHIYK